MVRSLCFRLAVLYALVFGLIQAVLFGTVLIIRETDLRRDFDEELVARAEGVAESFAAWHLPDLQSPWRQMPSRPLAHPTQAAIWRIVFDDGATIAGSGAAEEWFPPPPRPQMIDSAAPDWSPPVLQTLALPRAPERDRSRQFRIASIRYQSNPADPSERSYTVQVGRDLRPLESSIAALRRTIKIAIPGGMLIAALVAMAVARPALAPITAIARQAGALSATALRQRVPMPRRASSEVVQLADSFNAMLARLQRAFEAHQRFLADVAHELKTPVTALAAEAQLVAEQAACSTCAGLASRVHNEMHRLARLTEAFLTLARTDAGYPLDSLAPVRLDEVLTEAVRSCLPLALARNISLPTIIPAHGPEPLVQGDQQLLVSMVDNIIRNAIAHSPDERPVHLTLTLNQMQAIIAIEDHGPGIPSEHAEHIFDRLFSLHTVQTNASGADNALLPSTTGAGLGLAIARAIARAHGGDVRLATSPAARTCFEITLPLLHEGPVSESQSSQPGIAVAP
jgi:signal transduction histidine kinase